MATIAIVTGASSGLGWEFAKQLDQADNLDEIWLIARRENRLRELAAELTTKGVVIPLDLTAADAVDRIEAKLVEAKPRIAWLINNAGYGLIGRTADLDRERQMRMIDLNVRALVGLTHAALPYMAKGDRIVLVGSSAGFAPMPGFNVYAATKAFVWSFAQGLRVELKPRGIGVTCVCPGPVDTEFQQVADIPADKNPKALNASPEAVVAKAIADARRGKVASIYGVAIQGYRVISNLLPNQAIMAVVDRLYRKS